jgi:hypothetical protein
MNKVTVIVLSVQNVDLIEYVPPGAELVLAPRHYIEWTRAVGDLRQALRGFLNDLQKTPHYNMQDPVYLFVNSTPAGLAAACVIDGYCSVTQTSLHVWVLWQYRGEKGRYVPLHEFRMEGYDAGFSFDSLQRNALNGAIPD